MQCRHKADSSEEEGGSLCNSVLSRVFSNDHPNGFFYKVLDEGGGLAYHWRVNVVSESGGL
jgi:hypothetical protein